MVGSTGTKATYHPLCCKLLLTMTRRPIEVDAVWLGGPFWCLSLVTAGLVVQPARPDPMPLPATRSSRQRPSAPALQNRWF